MHVLQVTPYFPPTWAYGGIPRIVYGLSRALVGQGARVTVWTTDAMDGDGRARVPEVRDHEGIRVLVSRNVSNRLAYRQQLFLPRGGEALLERELGAVDLVHLHGHRHLLNNTAVDLARRRGVPYVMTPNGTLPRHERKLAVKTLWDALISGRIPGGAERLVAVSPAEVGHFQRAGIRSERIARIPNGLMLEEFEDLPPRGLFKRKWGIDGRIVAYLGQISPRKGVEHLVEAFKGGRIPDATLVVGGNDMGAMNLARATADHGVVFTGLLEGRDRLAMLVDADVLVYPSTDEVFGLVPFEGLMCGAPVVVGGDCGCGQLIGAAGAGLLMRHADVEGLRRRIQTLLDDRVAARAMVSRGRRYIQERLSFDVVARQHRDLYDEVVRAHRDGASGAT